MDEVNKDLSEFGLQVKVLPLEKIKPYPNNAKHHADDALDAIYEKIGFKNVIYKNIHLLHIF